MLASVGPYMFSSRRPADQRAAVSPEHRSPPVLTARSAGSRSGGSVSRSAGVLTRIPISRSRSSSASRPGESTTSRPTGCSAAPESRAKKISSSEASKPVEASCATRSPGRAPKVSTAPASRFAAPAWVTTTPLGSPVEPEV
jgi:hypothetical protein